MAQVCVLILIKKSIVLVVEYGDSSLSKLSKSPGARCFGAFSCSFSTFSHTESLNIVNTTIFRIKHLATTKNSSIFAES